MSRNQNTRQNRNIKTANKYLEGVVKLEFL